MHLLSLKVCTSAEKCFLGRETRNLDMLQVGEMTFPLRLDKIISNDHYYGHDDHFIMVWLQPLRNKFHDYSGTILTDFDLM